MQDVRADVVANLINSCILGRQVYSLVDGGGGYHELFVNPPALP